jgi:flavin-dependent dehydrogenase
VSQSDEFDVIAIGAGPSGAIASALLVKKGYRVLVLEKEQFPRFSIGESLLPQCMAYLEEAGMLQAVHDEGFQFKNGAAFQFRGELTDFDFGRKFSAGWGTTYQVQRARFDQILADQAMKIGADIRYQHEVTTVSPDPQRPSISYRDPEGHEQRVSTRFILDGSGFGRVLPRLLDLDTRSDFPVRQSLFTHVRDNIDSAHFDRNKILITVHPEERDVWYWLIPFGNGTASVGVVAEPAFFARYSNDRAETLAMLFDEDPYLKDLLAAAEVILPVREIIGYSANVKSLHGPGYALLGNSGEFLDPVFSSGVTIAMRSASMAAHLLDRQFNGDDVDWQNDFAIPLKEGVDTFRTFIEGWYDQSLQDVIFYRDKQANIKAMIASILAGYAWDNANPLVANSKRGLNALTKLCRVTS